jgi:hypothetical protein
MPLWMPALGGGSITSPTGNPFTVNTTDATPTVLASFPVGTNQTKVMQAFIKGVRTGGAAGTTGDAAGYIMMATVKDIAGTATVISGGTATPVTGEDQAAWNVTIDTSGANARVNVTGAASNNITWTCNIIMF